ADRYPEPFAFRPERFLGGAPATSSWVPFGGGVRRCIGAAFAEMEMRVALQEIVRSRVLAPGSPRAERVARRKAPFSPKHGTPVTPYTRRRGEVSRRPHPVSTVTPSA